MQVKVKKILILDVTLDYDKVSVMCIAKVYLLEKKYVLNVCMIVWNEKNYFPPFKNITSQDTLVIKGVTCLISWKFI